MIVVDWREGAKAPNYNQAVANTRVVGAKIAELLLVMKQLGQDLAKVHLIGHSLGAQISGQAGKLVRLASGGNDLIGRITGVHVYYYYTSKQEAFRERRQLHVCGIVNLTL